MTRIAIVAGEASGDLLGAGLIRALRKRIPDISVEGVAGPAMQAEGCKVLEESVALSVMGLVEPIRHIPRLMKLRRSLLRRWSNDRPSVVVGIDSPDFNLGLEQRLRQRGIRTIHYVSPSVWAWRQGRVRKIRKAADKVLCLLPFEKRFYDEHGIAAEFVGHTMAERIAAEPDCAEARRRLGIAANHVVAVLPGSRHSELERLGPVFAAACALLQKDPELRDIAFVAPMATKSICEMFRIHVKEAGVQDSVRLLDGDSESALTAADVALMASGTATLEAALLKTPLVAAYKVAPLTYAIAMAFRLLKTPYIALPNLLTEKPVVPEIKQNDATPDALAAAVKALLLDDERRREIIEAFSGLRPMLARGADERAADAVQSLLANGGLPGQ